MLLQMWPVVAKKAPRHALRSKGESVHVELATQGTPKRPKLYIHKTAKEKSISRKVAKQ